MALTPQEIVAKTGDLPTLPHVATKVMKLVSNPSTSALESPVFSIITSTENPEAFSI